MAILNENKKYIKINFDRCAVQGYNIFVDYDIYPDEAERLKEKGRAAEIAAFWQTINDKYQELDENLNMEMNQLHIETQEEFESHSSLVKQADFNSDLEFFIRNFISATKVVNNYQSEQNIISSDIKPLLLALGFKEEWINDPICYTGGGTVYCGQYNNEDIDYSFYYNKLKEIMDSKPLENV